MALCLQRQVQPLISVRPRPAAYFVPCKPTRLTATNSAKRTQIESEKRQRPRSWWIASLNNRRCAWRCRRGAGWCPVRELFSLAATDSRAQSESTATALHAAAGAAQRHSNAQFARHGRCKWANCPFAAPHLNIVCCVTQRLSSRTHWNDSASAHPPRLSSTTSNKAKWRWLTAN